MHRKRLPFHSGPDFRNPLRGSSFLIPTFVPVIASQLGAQKITWQSADVLLCARSGRKRQAAFPQDVRP
jgi:hypothetical protein